MHDTVDLSSTIFLKRPPVMYHANVKIQKLMSSPKITNVRFALTSRLLPLTSVHPTKTKNLERKKLRLSEHGEAGMSIRRKKCRENLGQVFISPSKY